MSRKVETGENVERPKSGGGALSADELAARAAKAKEKSTKKKEARPPMKRLNVNVDEDFYYALKEEAARQRATITHLVVRVLGEYMREREIERATQRDLFEPRDITGLARRKRGEPGTLSIQAIKFAQGEHEAEEEERS